MFVFETKCTTCISKVYLGIISNFSCYECPAYYSHCVYSYLETLLRCFCCFCIASPWLPKRLVSLHLLCKRSMVRCCHRALTLSAHHRIFCTRHCITGSHRLMSALPWYLFYGILFSQLFVFFDTGCCAYLIEVLVS